MICVLVADIEHSWVGDTEKAIKGLFNLVNMLSPCMLFFDEADSLFRRRTPEDRDMSEINLISYCTKSMA